MNTITVKLFGSGQVTSHTFCEEKKKDYNVEYYENKNEFGLRFPKGIPAGELLMTWRELPVLE